MKIPAEQRSAGDGREEANGGGETETAENFGSCNEERRAGEPGNDRNGGGNQRERKTESEIHGRAGEAGWHGGI